MELPGSPSVRVNWEVIFQPFLRPTVSLGVTSAVAYTYGYGDGRIEPARCALIAVALGDRWSRGRVCRTPPAAARSTHSALAVVSRPASAAAPGAFRRSRTTLRSRTRPCGDASPARDRNSTRL